MNIFHEEIPNDIMLILISEYILRLNLFYGGGPRTLVCIYMGNIWCAFSILSVKNPPLSSRFKSIHPVRCHFIQISQMDYSNLNWCFTWVDRLSFVHYRRYLQMTAVKLYQLFLVHNSSKLST